MSFSGRDNTLYLTVKAFSQRNGFRGAAKGFFAAKKVLGGIIINMSELQNKAVQAVIEKEKYRSNHAQERNEALLSASLELFIAIGGKKQAAVALLDGIDAARRFSVAEAVANIVLEIAVISQLSDLDMVQAVNVHIEAMQDKRKRS